MEDKLSNLIARYNADKELNNLKDKFANWEGLKV